MERQRAVLAHAVPAMTITAALLFAFAVERHWWGGLPLVAAVLLAPLWPWVARRNLRSDSRRAELTLAVNVHLSALVGYLIGAVLTLLFVGILVILAVLVSEVAFSGSAAYSTWKGKRSCDRACPSSMS